MNIYMDTDNLLYKLNIIIKEGINIQEAIKPLIDTNPDELLTAVKCLNKIDNDVVKPLIAEISHAVKRNG